VILAAGDDRDGHRMLILGFSREAIERLLVGRPVWVTSAELAALHCPEMSIVVTAAETEEMIEEQLRMLNPHMRDVEAPDAS
jgi:hypothetical protein